MVRCFFCNGNMIDHKCLMCGRSDDVAMELRIKREKAKEHRNWHGSNPPEWKRRRRAKEKVGDDW